MSTPTVLDLCGFNEGILNGFAPVSPEQAFDAAACIAAHALSLEDQRDLTEMCGLDASPAPAAPAREPRQPAEKVDGFRRGTRGGKR